MATTGIEQRIRQAGDQVGGAGAGSGDANADFAGGAGVADGGHGGALFMAAQQVFHTAVVQRIVHRHDCPARIAEYGIHTLRTQRLNYPLSAIHSYFPALLRQLQDFVLFFMFCPLLHFSLANKKPPDLTVRGFSCDSGLFAKPFFVQVQPRTVG